jgi:hypothetical protein
MVQWPRACQVAAPSPLFFSPNLTPPHALPVLPHRSPPAACASLPHSARTPPHFFLSTLSPSTFYSSSSSKNKLLPPPAIAAALRAPMTRRHAPSLPPGSHQKGAHTPPHAPRAHHPTQDPWSQSKIKFSPPSFRALPPPHGSPSSSKLAVKMMSTSSGSPHESRHFTRVGQPELLSHCRSTMEAGAIPSSELLCVHVVPSSSTFVVRPAAPALGRVACHAQ